MTGFGKAEGQYGDDFFFTVEISSVNRKQLEVRCSLPPELSGMESLIRQRIGTFISRGSVSVKVMLRKNALGGQKIDTAFLSELVAAARKIRVESGLTPEVNVEELMSLPGVIAPVCDNADSPGLSEAFSKVLNAAGEEFGAMRSREGAALKTDLSDRANLLEELLRQIEPLAAKVPEAARKRLYCKLAAEKLQVEPNDELYKPIIKRIIATRCSSIWINQMFLKRSPALKVIFSSSANFLTPANLPEEVWTFCFRSSSGRSPLWETRHLHRSFPHWWSNSKPSLRSCANRFRMWSDVKIL